MIINDQESDVGLTPPPNLVIDFPGKKTLFSYYYSNYYTNWDALPMFWAFIHKFSKVKYD